MYIFRRFCLAAVILTAVSCGTPRNITYFQDTRNNNIAVKVKESPVRIRPEDKISIIVNCQDPKVTNLFNLPYITQRLGQTTDSAGSSSQGVSGYTVDKNGNIDFPVLGLISIDGLTREEVASKIKNELVERSLVKDPVVTVEFLNLSFSVFGEVNNPGRHAIDRDCLTVLDAISMASDLTIYGNRQNVRLLRIDNGVQKSYTIDLTSAQQVASSPVFYIKQNDVIYVEPNDVRMRQSTVNGNNVRSSSFWISLLSLAASVTNIMIRI